MREILFKAKRRDNGEWVEGNLVHCKASVDKSELCLIVCSAEWLDNPKWFNLCNTHYVDPETVCQYTGLKDSNGNKVWENDIIRYADKTDFDCYVESLENPEDYEGCDYSDIFTEDKIIYQSERDYPAFDMDRHHFDCNGLSELMCGDWHFEVIGNIFDNELIMEQKLVVKQVK